MIARYSFLQRRWQCSVAPRSPDANNTDWLFQNRLQLLLLIGVIAKLQLIHRPLLVRAAKGTREIGSRVPEQLIIDYRSAKITAEAAGWDEALVSVRSAA